MQPRRKTTSVGVLAILIGVGAFLVFSPAVEREAHLAFVEEGDPGRLENSLRHLCWIRSGVSGLNELIGSLEPERRRSVLASAEKIGCLAQLNVEAGEIEPGEPVEVTSAQDTEHPSSEIPAGGAEMFEPVEADDEGSRPDEGRRLVPELRPPAFRIDSGPVLYHAQPDDDEGGDAVGDGREREPVEPAKIEPVNVDEPSAEADEPDDAGSSAPADPPAPDADEAGSTPGDEGADDEEPDPSVSDSDPEDGAEVAIDDSADGGSDE